GLYEQLLTAGVARAVEALRSGGDGIDPASVEGLDPAEAPSHLAAHVASVVERALRSPRVSGDAAAQVALCNSVVRVLSARDTYAPTRQIYECVEAALLPAIETAPAALHGRPRLVRPSTPLSQHALFVHAPHEPSLGAELARELASADQVDLLCAFVVWSG